MVIHLKQVHEVIVVEGQYDKNRVSQVVDATIIETSGFGFIKNADKVTLLRKLAEKRGIIILTDNDKAGFFIRGRLKDILGNKNIKHAYIPDIKGQEKRKKVQSKEGKLGVESMSKDAIIKALTLAGATFTDEALPKISANTRITKADLFELGLTGQVHSSLKRRELLKQLQLPERLPTNGLLDVLNILYSKDEFIEYFSNPENSVYKV
ncbi:MAG: DUF4093 domain-containing protein [Oscillospiraceae bacterium]|nr:DUF4093 domain-containing protein [Oscillospiraceae bacterium]